MDSIWLQTAELPTFAPQGGDMRTDVLIIGGGMAGILCAHMLDKAGVDYVLVEADRICSGITKDTTAKITVQHGLLYDKLIRRFGLERAQLYYRAQTAALAQYHTLCRTIDCDFTEADSYVYALSDHGKIEREAEALERIGCHAAVVERLPLPLTVAGAIRIEGQAQFHPLKFVCALAKNLRILEQTKVLELRPDGAVTQHGRIAAKMIIVATHFPFLNKHGAYFLKLYQHRSYVLGLEQAADVKGMYVDESGKGLSFRNFDNLLLLGGGGHRTGKQGGGWRELEAFARRNYPDAREVCRWATQDCMSLDSVPYIGQYAHSTPNLYVATGFNKWGMTSSMVAAMLLRDLILGKTPAYALVFSPSRSIFHPQLAVNAAQAIAGLLTPTAPRCPHMGCALKYNREEHTWDCACHGSRFAEDGSLIDNPATGDRK